MEYTAEEIDEEEVIRREMLERQLKEMEPEQARTDEIMTAYLGYTDSELDYDTATSPTTSEVALRATKSLRCLIRIAFTSNASQTPKAASSALR